MFIQPRPKFRSGKPSWIILTWTAIRRATSWQYRRCVLSEWAKIFFCSSVLNVAGDIRHLTTLSEKMSSLIGIRSSWEVLASLNTSFQNSIFAVFWPFARLKLVSYNRAYSPRYQKKERDSIVNTSLATSHPFHFCSEISSAQTLVGKNQRRAFRRRLCNSQ